MDKIYKSFFKTIWFILVIASLFGFISFSIGSLIMVWGLALVLIVHLNPNYDIAFLSKITSWMIKLFIFELIILIIDFVLLPAIKNLKGGNKKCH